MFELGHLAAAYVIGTAAGLALFHTWIKEKVVTKTLDSLIEQGYLFSWIDDDGITQLSKWGDIEKSTLDIIDEMSTEEIAEILDELIEEDKRNTDEEQDDTP